MGQFEWLVDIGKRSAMRGIRKSLMGPHQDEPNRKREKSHQIILKDHMIESNKNRLRGAKRVANGRI
jgi:hypothetical protein